MVSILPGVFATMTSDAAGADGLFAGNARFLGMQVAAVAIITTCSLVATWLTPKVLNVFERVPVPDAIGLKGLDSEIHGEAAYVLD